MTEEFWRQRDREDYDRWLRAQRARVPEPEPRPRRCRGCGCELASDVHPQRKYCTSECKRRRERPKPKGVLTQKTRQKIARSLRGRGPVVSAWKRREERGLNGCCLSCKRVTRRHESHGLCVACYRREKGYWRKEHRDRSEYYRRWEETHREQRQRYWKERQLEIRKRKANRRAGPG